MAAQSHTADQRRALSEVQRLRDTIYAIDALSQEGFSEIESIAELALAALGTPEGYRHTESIAIALKVVSGKASEIKDCISSEAEEVGCNRVDTSKKRHW